MRIDEKIEKYLNESDFTYSNKELQDGINANGIGFMIMEIEPKLIEDKKLRPLWKKASKVFGEACNILDV